MFASFESVKSCQRRLIREFEWSDPSWYVLASMRFVLGRFLIKTLCVLGFGCMVIIRWCNLCVLFSHGADARFGTEFTVILPRSLGQRHVFVML